MRHVTHTQIFVNAVAARLRAFAQETRGTLSVETALIMPFLLGLFAVTYVWYDAFRTKNAVLKATYSVADMISRETVPMTDNYFNGLTTVFTFMIETPDPTSLRITTVKCTEKCDDDALRELEMCWSWASGDYPAHNTTTFQALEEAIPLMVLGDTVVVTEGRVEYTPLFRRWMDDMELRNTIVTRPRFTPQVAYGELRCYAGDGTSSTIDEDSI